MTDKTDKFPKEQRNFETRLLFLKSIFDDVYEPYDILLHCIAHKLDRSYLVYEDQLAWNTQRLECDDRLLLKLKSIK